MNRIQRPMKRLALLPVLILLASCSRSPSPPPKPPAPPYDAGLRATQAGVGLINVLSLESYLRGVVPSEMGPARFPALEALKAQAVAARTYAVAHLGDHEDEGYDLCATPACQVYGGVDAERPLTDRAVARTAGVILTWQGAPIDAMYQSTCGGHTEDAAAILPDRAAPYLVGVPCRAESTVRVTGTGGATGWMGPVERLAAVAGRVAAIAGVAAEPRALASRLGGRPAGPGIAGLLHAFGLDDALILLHGTAGTDERREVLALLDTFRLPLDAPDGTMSAAAWNLALVLRLAQVAGAVRTVDGRVLADPAGVRVVADKDGSVTELTGREMVLERRGGTFRRTDVTVRAGAPATLWCVGDRCPAVEIERWEEADSGSAWSWWLRDVPLGQVSRALGLPGVTGLEVARRGVSGRALSVSVAAAAGRREVDGFAFRRALDLPDTLFVVTLRRTPDGTVAHFVGRGWGHGIGLCQNGAFGLAQAGETFGEILATYYTGATLSTWPGSGKGSQ